MKGFPGAKIKEGEPDTRLKSSCCAVIVNYSESKIITLMFQTVKWSLSGFICGSLYFELANTNNLLPHGVLLSCPVRSCIHFRSTPSNFVEVK